MTFTPRFLREGLHHLFRLVQAQQAIVDEHTGQLLADGAMHQCGRDRGIHAAGQAENDFFVADLCADLFHGFADVIRHVPVLAAAADIMHETVDDGLALVGMRDFRMELHAHRNGAFRPPSPAIGVAALDAMTEKPGGSAVTLSP